MPNADLNNPPVTNLSNVLSSVGVNTPSSSNGINSTSAFASGVVLKVNDVVDPSPLNTSSNFIRVLSSDVT